MKSRTLLFLVFIFITFTPASAMYEGRKVSDPKERKIIDEKLDKLHEGIESIRATIDQRKHITLLKKEIVTKGYVTLQKPTSLRLETVSPERSIIVVDDKTMRVYRPDEKKAEEFDLSGNVIARNTVQYFREFILGPSGGIDSRFDINVYINDSFIVYELIPTSKIIAKYLMSIIILYEKDTGLPESFTVTTPRGDKTITKLTNIDINPHIEPGTFDLNLPADVKIIKKLEDGQTNSE